jgi:hypothetical protein
MPDNDETPQCSRRPDDRRSFCTDHSSTLVRPGSAPDAASCKDQGLALAGGLHRSGALAERGTCSSQAREVPRAGSSGCHGSQGFQSPDSDEKEAPTMSGHSKRPTNSWSADALFRCCSAGAALSPRSHPPLQAARVCTARTDHSVRLRLSWVPTKISRQKSDIIGTDTPTLSLTKSSPFKALSSTCWKSASSLAIRITVIRQEQCALARQEEPGQMCFSASREGPSQCPSQRPYACHAYDTKHVFQITMHPSISACFPTRGFFSCGAPSNWQSVRRTVTVSAHRGNGMRRITVRE